MAKLMRIGEVAKAVGVSVDTLRRWEADGRVAFVRKGSQRYLPADRLGELVEGRELSSAASSARNHMEGIVVEVVKDRVMAKVEMICGPHRIVSLMSREAADELELEPGVAAVAVIKSTNVVIER